MSQENKVEPKVGVGIFVLNPLSRFNSSTADPTFLIGKRISNVNHGDGQWSLPGGGLDLKEDPKECAKREVREEFGIEITEPQILLPQPYTSDIFEGSKKGEHYITLFFVSWMISGQTPIIQEEEGGKKHSEWKWINIPGFIKEQIPLFPPLDKLVDDKHVRGFLRGFALNPSNEIWP